MQPIINKHEIYQARLNALEQRIKKANQQLSQKTEELVRKKNAYIASIEQERQANDQIMALVWS